MRTSERPKRWASIVAAAALAVLAAGPARAGTPSIAFDVSAWDYGALHLNIPQFKTFVLTNNGSSTGSTLTMALTGSPAFSITADACTGVALSQKKSCSVTVQFTLALGPQTATLTASSKKPAAVASVSLAGRGGEPVLSVSPATFNLGRWNFSFVEAQVSQTFTVTNVGDGPADVVTTLDLGAGDVLSVVNDACDEQPLAAGASCTFDLTIDAAACTPDGLDFSEFYVTAYPYLRDEILVVLWGCPFA